MPPPRSKAMRLRGNEVRIRMYGQGVGDCFLLALPRRLEAGAPAAGGKPVYVLIDCGVVGGTPQGPARMKRVVADIALATGGHLDLLVISHEHWDHLSGFVQAAEEWEGIEVGALWLGWTEKPEAGLPQVLKRIMERQNRAILRAAEAVQQFGLGERHQSVIGLSSFLSDAAGETGSMGLAAAPGVSDAFGMAKAKVPAAEHVFCEPGEVHRVPGSVAMAYVLGPPRDDGRLRQLNPSKKRSETYSGAEEADDRPGAGITLQFLAEGRSEFNAVAMPFVAMERCLGASGETGDPALSAEDEDALSRSYPFDRRVRVPLARAEAAVRAEPGVYGALDGYFEELSHWRRIDYDWIASAEAFALRADSLTNNTSLALAFELPASANGGPAPILLFVGDAQVGNWLSWDDIPDWRPVGDARPTQERPDIAELLGRTAFYKVGHHGSHNATLKVNGVERMPARTAERPLAAFVPVSPAVARDLKGWTEMPLDNLLAGLALRAPGRVILPNGRAWDATAAEAKADPDAGLHVTTSNEVLPPVLDREGNQLEAGVPVWVEVAIRP